MLREVIRDEKRIRVGVDVVVFAPHRDILRERADRGIVADRKKRVVITPVTLARGPRGKSNAAFIRCVACRHPFGLRDPDAIEEFVHLRGRALADPNDADIARFEQ